MNNLMKISYLSTLVLALTVCSVGCAGLRDSGLRGTDAFRGVLSDDEPEFKDPRSMVAIWKPSTFEKPGSTSIRGFGGRFYFYDAQNEPVKVEGLLTIYGYDDEQGDTSGKASRKFVFDSSTFQQHYSESGIGASYSFWIPWEKVGGFEKTITLIPVFKSINGEIPESKPATLRLPGKKAEVVASAQDSLYGPGTQVISASGVVSTKPMVQQAVALDEIEPASTGRRKGTQSSGRSKTTTFRLPRNLADRIARAAPTTGAGGDTNAADQSNHQTQKAKGNAAINQASHIGNAIEASSKDSGPNTSKNRRNRPVFGQPGSF